MAAARRCSTCGINYPAIYGFERCPVHGSLTILLNSDKIEVDDDWEQRAAILKGEQPEDPADETFGPLVDATVDCRDGQLFVHMWDVQTSARRRLEPHDLFRIGKQTFEVLEYIEDAREYWVRSFETTVTEETFAGLLG